MLQRFWKYFVIVGIVSALGFGALHEWWIPHRSVAADSLPGAKGQRYHCPMHPTMVSDRPGDCPICGMRMVPVEDGDGVDPPNPPIVEATGQDAHSINGGKKMIYRSTMNLSEVSDHPGKDSMGMDMVAEEVDDTPPGDAVAGRTNVRLSERKRQLIGVRTTPVGRQPLTRNIRTVGRVTTDETHLHHVHTKIGGWVQALYANATGEQVRRGQPLLTIYSPELVASAQEYLLALHAREKLDAAAIPSVQQSGARLATSARRRLLLFDLTPQQIEALERRGEVPTTMTLQAPISGHIIGRNVTQGERIEPETNLLDIADLSQVWVLADIYEYELPFIHVGQQATMRLSYLPGRTFTGKVKLIYPVLSETTRTVKVRLEFPNPDFSLRPEMYAEVEINADLGERLVVPESAVIGSGTRDVAFVADGSGYFQPRELKLGIKLPDVFEVLDGVAEGERVVVSGNFLLDSESKLKAALSVASQKSSSEGTSAHSGHAQ